MPSVRQIAQEAGVSIATVSRALNNDAGISAETRDKVMAVAEDQGYPVAASNRRPALSIGFAYTGEPTLAHPFDAAVLEGVTQGAADRGMGVTLLNIKQGRLRRETYTQFFTRHGVGGVILRTMSDSRDVCLEIAREGFPHIVVSERFDEPEVNSIDCDSRGDSLRAIEYLISLGHRRIAFATHNIPDRDHLDRYEGYLAALEKHGVELNEELIYRHNASLAGGATVMKIATSAPTQPTAIYFADWLLAVGGIKAAHELGIKIPERLSVVGVDDTMMRHALHPSLTAVCQNAVRLGLQAAVALTSLLSGSSKKKLTIVVPSYFEINASTGAPPSASVSSQDQGSTDALPSHPITSSSDSTS